jgi:ribulose-phosphate 3-epimerase
MAWREWVQEFEIEPSIYAANFAALGADLERALDAGARIFHFDVGDGHFVEPITIGPIVLESIAPLVHSRGAVLDCHLMVDNPERHFAQIAKAGGDSVTFHHEVVADVGATAAKAGELGLGAGLAFSPESEVADVAARVEGVDLVLCMSIHPGYSGQAFMPEALERIRKLREALDDTVYVQVDGGIKADNVRAAREAGAELLVAGSALFDGVDPGAAYRRLVDAAS